MENRSVGLWRPVQAVIEAYLRGEGSVISINPKTLEQCVAFPVEKGC